MDAETVRQKRAQATGFVRNQVERQTNIAGERVSTTAGSLRSLGREMRDRGEPEVVSDLADTLAGYAERAGAYLKEADVDQLLGDLESYGRRQPATVIAASLIAGFAASRLLKVSASRRYRYDGDYREDGDWNSSPR